MVVRNISMIRFDSDLVVASLVWQSFIRAQNFTQLDILRAVYCCLAVLIKLLNNRIVPCIGECTFF